MAKRTISATIEESFVKMLSEVAEARGISRSRLLEECIAAWLEQVLRAPRADERRLSRPSRTPAGAS